AEQLIRSIVHDWANEQPNRQSADWHPSWYEFKTWLLERHPRALSFRSTGGADMAAENWFDDELGQTWRN
ncbi:MAG: hypothetical protein VX228_01070, partial [Pseudomonadota bacterium]|nr:hypothetical protein [Pseudomonadota bacterium]